MDIETQAKQIADELGRDWIDCGAYERESFRDEACRRLDGKKQPMPKELDRKLFAAALSVITDTWSDTMSELQRASLANQIVREIERRQIVQA